MTYEGYLMETYQDPVNNFNVVELKERKKSQMALKHESSYLTSIIWYGLYNLIYINYLTILISA